MRSPVTVWFCPVGDAHDEGEFTFSKCSANTNYSPSPVVRGELSDGMELLPRSAVAWRTDAAVL